MTKKQQDVLIAVTCVSMLLFVGYFFLGEIAGYWDRREYAMKRECDHVREMTSPANRARTESMLRNMATDEIRREKRRVEACLDYWRDGTINLADAQAPDHRPTEFEQRLWSMTCREARRFEEEHPILGTMERRSVNAKLADCDR